MNKNLFLIGGGEIGRPGSQIETFNIDKQIINTLQNTQKPKLLFIAPVSDYDKDYFNTFSNYYKSRFNAEVDVIYLNELKNTHKDLEDKTQNTDIIYVGGGDTSKIISRMKDLKLFELLLKAYEKGITLAGISAGAMCWFKYGCTDAYLEQTGEYKLIDGIGLLKAVLMPHFNEDEERSEFLKESLKKSDLVGLGLDNRAAIHIQNNSYKILSDNGNSSCYKCFWDKNHYHQNKLLISEEFISLDDLCKF